MNDHDPYDPEPDAQAEHPAHAAERAVLGAILLSPRALDDATEIIGPHHCYQPRHELILAAAIALTAEGITADPLTVADHLAHTGDLGRAGGAAYLNQLAANTATPESATHYATIVRNAHTQRAVHAAGTRLASMTTPENTTTTEDTLDLVNLARAELDDLVTDDTDAPPVDQAVWQAIETLEQDPGTPTPWTSLTNAIAGWAPGNLYIVGARPSIGKTVIGANITLDAARRHQLAPFYSLEMTRDELLLRMMSNVGTINGSDIRHRRLSGDDWAKLSEAANHISALPLHIDDRAGLSLAQIHASLRALRRKHDTIGPVVVDYLGLLTPPNGAPRGDRRVAVDMIARGLKNLAKELNLPIIALAQINRGPEGRPDKMPQMSDLRESGEIENAADTVLLLHRELNPERGDPSELRIGIPKNRHGPTTQLKLTFAGHYSRATEPTTWTAPIERSAS